MEIVTSFETLLPRLLEAMVSRMTRSISSTSRSPPAITPSSVLRSLQTMACTTSSCPRGFSATGVSEEAFLAFFFLQLFHIVVVVVVVFPQEGRCQVFPPPSRVRRELQGPHAFLMVLASESPKEESIVTTLEERSQEQQDCD